MNVDLPRGAFTVVTGVSGSGKSSLAVDTLYAEGQRRYLDSVSAHARRFLERVPRPAVESVLGLSPAVCVRQRSTARSARSTVGTSTEVSDYLRLLFARIGRVSCDRCGKEVPRWTVAKIVEEWVGNPGRHLVVSFPVSGRGADWSATKRALQARGYLRIVVGNRIEDLERAPSDPKEWDVVQDRVRTGDPRRLAEALEAALVEGRGRAAVHPEGAPPSRYRLGRVCSACDVSYPDPDPLHFSFNSPMGACPSCHGFGYILEFDPDKIIPDPDKTLDEGAILPWAGRWRTYFHKKLETSPRARRIPRDVAWKRLLAPDRDVLLHGGGGFPGVFPFLRRLSAKSYKAGARFLVKRYQSPSLCPECAGTRLGREGRRVRVGGETFSEWCERPVGTLRARLSSLGLQGRDAATVQSLLEDLDHRLEVLERVGLGYLTLSRLTRTLSGGETQRIELAQALGARLVDTLYVLDEPTVGLHPADTERLLDVLRDLSRRGNTVVVVEHDLAVIRASDWMVDLGPGPGREGGTVVYCGPTRDRGQGKPSPTRELMARAGPVPRPEIRKPGGWLRIRGASLHNLDSLDVDLPWGVLAGVCGVSGSGKSTLVADTLVPLLEAWDRSRSGGREGKRKRFVGSSRVSTAGIGTLRVDAPCRGFRVVDQTPLSRSARSVPVSYVGAWSGIRALFASLPDSKRLGLTPGMFSFNVPGGRCDVCRGEGEVMVDMDFMPDVRIPCEACEGARFGTKARVPRYRGFNIVDVLGLTVEQALAVFASVPTVARPLWWLQRVGLGYLTLGQPAPSLSGGEAQRLKLTREMASGGGGRLIILDEPTVGLHGTEVMRLVDLLREMVRAGNTVLVVEHHLDVLASCDWLVELGPDGGNVGGQLVAWGTPADVARKRESRIAPFLSPVLGTPANSSIPGRMVP